MKASLSSREKRALIALSQSPVMREELDSVAGCSNSPELVSCLRKMGLELPCYRIEKIDVDKNICYPGRYELTEDDKLIVCEWLGGNHDL